MLCRIVYLNLHFNLHINVLIEEIHINNFLSKSQSNIIYLCSLLKVPSALNLIGSVIQYIKLSDRLSNISY